MLGLPIWVLLVVSGLVLYRLLRRFQRARLVKWLKSHGQLVRATVTSVRKELHGEKGSFTERMWDLVPHYEITAQWVDPKTERVYRFQRTGRGRLARRYVPGGSVSVLIDPTDPRRYYIAL
jgi:hypothetical protein